MNAGVPGRKILLILLIIALISGMLVLIYFRLDGIRKAYEALAAEKAALKRDEEALAKLEALKCNEDELIGEYNLALKRMPEKPDEDELIKYLQMKAEAAMLKFDRIEFYPRESEDGYVGMPVELSFSGNYEDLLEFLELIADGERAIRIDALNISPLDDGSGQIMANISARGFCQADDAAQDGKVKQ